MIRPTAMRRRTFLSLTGAAAASVAAPRVRAADVTTLRLAALAPKGSSWDLAFRAWNNSLRAATAGRLQLDLRLGATDGTERQVLKKMRAGDLDGAVITTTGLSEIARPTLLMSLPGLFPDYAALDRVRAALDGDFRAMVEKGGFSLLGWSDLGRARIFADRPIARPTDLKGLRTWAFRDDDIFPQFLALVGAKTRSLDLNEVLPALSKGELDAFPASALAAVSLQWWNHAKYVTKQADSVLIGATVMRKERIDALPEDLRAPLMETAARAHGLLAREIRKADDRAFAAILSHGVAEVDLTATQSEWQKAADDVRKKLVGKLCSAELMARVEKLAKG